MRLVSLSVQEASSSEKRECTLKESLLTLHLFPRLKVMSLGNSMLLVALNTTRPHHQLNLDDLILWSCVFAGGGWNESMGELVL
ncbi:hypothetical protein LguiB_033958 [Lonicera macranthoides]